MREITQRFHSKALAAHDALMYDTLVHPFNVTTETVKEFSFLNEEGAEMEPLRGYLALKEVSGHKIKYFLDEDDYHRLPVRVNTTEKLLLKDSGQSKSVILRPLESSTFRVNPEKIYKSMKDFIDAICPFSHSRPEMYNANKMIAVMGDVGKTFTGISTAPEFGKSSVYSALNALTKRSPVLQPRSIPGVIIHITSDGNIVFDEISGIPNDVKTCIMNFSLIAGANEPMYINGAMKAHGLRQIYNIMNQSITFLYNLYSNYTKPDEDFFDYMFKNNDGIDSRFLKFKLEGKLTEKFDADFDIMQTATENRMFYMGIAKHLLYLKQLKLTNSYERKYSRIQSSINMKERHRRVYDEITWGWDMWAESEKEYEDQIQLMDDCIEAYQKMIGKQLHRQSFLPQEAKPIEVEDIVDAPPSPCHVCFSANSTHWDGAKGICEECKKSKDVNQR